MVPLRMRRCGDCGKRFPLETLATVEWRDKKLGPNATTFHTLCPPCTKAMKDALGNDPMTTLYVHSA